MNNEEARREAHNHEVRAREEARAAKERVDRQKHHDRMSAEIRRQEVEANAARAKKGGGCLPLLVAALLGFGAAGFALVEVVA
jgi:hypothetical protein